MKDRILQLMRSEGMSQQEFSKATGIAPASLSSIFTGRTAPTMKHAEAMHRYFPQLSMSWLLFGEGEMFTLTDEEMASCTRADGSPLEGESQSGIANHVSKTGATAGGVSRDQQTQHPVDPSSYQQSTYPYPSHNANLRAREGAEGMSKGIDMGSGVPFGYPPIYPGMSEMVKYQDIRQRKIVEIRIFFDDGTFETFQGN